jgi:hypothetical protein
MNSTAKTGDEVHDKRVGTFLHGNGCEGWMTGRSTTPKCAASLPASPANQGRGWSPGDGSQNTPICTRKLASVSLSPKSIEGEFHGAPNRAGNAVHPITSIN